MYKRELTAKVFTIILSAAMILSTTYASSFLNKESETKAGAEIVTTVEDVESSESPEEKLERLQAELEEKQADLSDKKEDLKTAESELATANEVYLSAKEDYEDDLNTLDTLAKEIENAEYALENYALEIEELEADIKELNNELEQVTERNTPLIESLNEELAPLLETLSKKQESLSAEEEVINGLKDEMDSLEAESIAKQEAYESAKAVYDEKSEIYKTALSNMGTAKIVLDNAQTNFLEQEEIVNEINEDIESTQISISNLTQSRAEKLQTILDKQSEIEDLYSTLAEYLYKQDNLPELLEKKAEAEAKYNRGSIAFFETIGPNDTYVYKKKVDGKTTYYEVNTIADLIDNCTWGEYVHIVDTGYSVEEALQSATSLENMKKSFDYIRQSNELRTSLGLSELSVTNEMMLYAQLDMDYSDSVIGHAQQFQAAENLYWGTADPFAGWYDQEKEIYEAALVETDGTGNLLYPDLATYVESMNLNAIQTNYYQLFLKIGHYLNLINYKYKCTGFAYRDAVNNKYKKEYAQEFYSSTKNTSYTLSVYEQIFNDYYNNLIDDMDVKDEGYEEDIETVGEQIQSDEDAISELYNDIDSIDEQLSVLNESLRELNTSLTTANEEYELRKNIVAVATLTYNDKKAIYDSALSEYAAAVVVYNSANEAKNLAITAYEKAVSDYNAEYPTYESLVSETAKAQAAASEVQDQIDVLNGEILDVSFELLTTQSEYYTKSQALEDAPGVIENNTAQIAAINETLEDKLDLFDLAKVDCQGKQVVVDGLKLDVASLEEEVKQLKAEIDEVYAEIIKETESESESSETESGSEGGETESGSEGGETEGGSEESETGTDAFNEDSNFDDDVIIETPGKLKVGKEYAHNGVSYKVLSLTEVSVGGIDKNAKSVIIKDTVTINGNKLRITTIKAKAFAGCKKLKSITIGKYIKKINKKAFYKCKKLKRVYIKSKVLKKVGKQAFKGTSKKMVVWSAKKKIKKYKKLLKKAGIYKKTKYKKLK